jgi:hypothetical protein
MSRKNVQVTSSEERARLIAALDRLEALGIEGFTQPPRHLVLRIEDAERLLDLAEREAS